MYTHKYYKENMVTTTENIHGKRCDGDPCYSIMFFPERGELNKLIETSIKMIKKKYGINNRVFMLLEVIDDDIPKLFTIFFLMVWEKNIANVLEEAYDGTGIFEKNDRNHFKDFVRKMYEFVEKTTKFAYDKNNVIEMVTNFVEAAKIEYIIGPTT